MKVQRNIHASQHQPVALITGASSGIGKALAEELARRQYAVVLVSLPEIELYRTATYLKLKFGVKAWAFSGDLCDPAVVARLSNFCSNNRLSVQVLVNCAGFGNLGMFCNSDWRENEKLITLNNLALVNMCNTFLPVMMQQRTGYILNVGSLASFFSIPGKAVYAASKRFVYAFSKSLSLEVRQTGVHVSCLCPGSTITSLKALQNIKDTNYSGTFFCQTPEAVAREAAKAMMSKKFRIIPGWKNKLLYFLWLIIPAFLCNAILQYIFMKHSVSSQTIAKQNTPNPHRIAA